jgi:hypothetical protein
MGPGRVPMGRSRHRRRRLGEVVSGTGSPQFAVEVVSGFACRPIGQGAPQGLQIAIRNRADLATISPGTDGPSQWRVRLNDPDRPEATHHEIALAIMGRNDPHNASQIAAVFRMDDDRQVTDTTFHALLPSPLCHGIRRASGVEKAGDALAGICVRPGKLSLKPAVRPNRARALLTTIAAHDWSAQQKPAGRKRQSGSWSPL